MLSLKEDKDLAVINDPYLKMPTLFSKLTSIQILRDFLKLHCLTSFKQPYYMGHN